MSINTPKLSYVKWAGPNTPYIKLSNSERQRILNKQELMELHSEISKFVEFYKTDFETPAATWGNFNNGGEPQYPL